MKEDSYNGHMGSDIGDLPPHVQAQIAAQGENLQQQGVEEAPAQSAVPEGQDVSQLPDHAQDQVAAQGETLAQNDVQATGDVSPESGPPTDWNQQPGGDVPEPAQVDQLPAETQAPTQEQ